MATDPRHKIYGLYGLASVSDIEQLGMPVDYHSKVPELYIIIASPLLSTRFGLDILMLIASATGPFSRAWSPIVGS
jgi:hypothetical protein